MPTATPRNGLLQQDLASNINRWGDPLLNTVIGLIDVSLDGILELDAGTPAIALTNTLYVDNQARYRILRLTGAQASDCVVTVPNIQKRWWVWNLSTGGSFNVVLKTAAGASVVCQRGAKTLVVCDSVDCFQFAPGSLSDLSEPTADVSMGGFRIINLGDGTNSNHAATVGQVTAAMGAPNPNINFLLQMAAS